jgi:hypothetical protein
MVDPLVYILIGVVSGFLMGLVVGSTWRHRIEVEFKGKGGNSNDWRKG